MVAWCMWWLRVIFCQIFSFFGSVLVFSVFICVLMFISLIVIYEFSGNSSSMDKSSALSSWLLPIYFHFLPRDHLVEHRRGLHVSLHSCGFSGIVFMFTLIIIFQISHSCSVQYFLYFFLGLCPFPGHCRHCYVVVFIGERNAFVFLLAVSVYKLMK